MIFLILFSLLAHAHSGLRIAFLEMRDYRGRLIRLEQEGRFAHTAISCRGQWVHAYPFRGVEYITEERLRSLGSNMEVLTLALPEPSAGQLAFFMGRPYDFEFSWEDGEIYCSELVGKIIGMPPEPMAFSGPAWEGKKISRRGERGLSPDKIHRNLTKTNQACSFSFSALTPPPVIVP